LGRAADFLLIVGVADTFKAPLDEDATSLFPESLLLVIVLPPVAPLSKDA